MLICQSDCFALLFHAYKRRAHCRAQVKRSLGCIDRPHRVYVSSRSQAHISSAASIVAFRSFKFVSVAYSIDTRRAFETLDSIWHLLLRLDWMETARAHAQHPATAAGESSKKIDRRDGNRLFKNNLFDRESWIRIAPLTRCVCTRAHNSINYNTEFVAQRMKKKSVRLSLWPVIAVDLWMNFWAEIDQSPHEHSESGFNVFSLDHVFVGANRFCGFISIDSQVMRNQEANIHISQRTRQENKTKF